MTRTRMVYTAVFGDASRDTLKSPTKVDGTTRYFVFTDCLKTAPQPYLVMPSLAPDESWSPRKKARWHKINSTKVLRKLFNNESMFTIWHDASFQLTESASVLETTYMTEPISLGGSCYSNLLMVCPHRERNCIYAETEECHRLKLITDHERGNIHDLYSNTRKWPMGNGLYETGMLFRRAILSGGNTLNNGPIQRMENKWWGDLQVTSLRDQIAFPWALQELWNAESQHYRVFARTVNRLPFANYHPHNSSKRART
jgi:hypothetical protein